MARLNVYVPDDLAEEAKASDLNVSQLTQQALRHELARRRAETWLDRVRRRRYAGVTHDHAMEALDAAREEFGAT
ncbi:type II toxin-antitoxin system CcdA family antitoxin [Jiangella sp. DSM 45060]|uniref:type II toxin-antitoxin system CcdA family antitoxin n=1 Tax=Jiangella sp. DSM 45060 TaxID=1798224 RepID=UPI00087D4088|nr:type II toxin-antitoxin system CcdA family antitoxin [Jiangella sp. DSM 45060]SDT58241.1 Post-segregation antitoxin (ccd killing mechanism protein) encoded by the F plasmid [Jiangella sp. DSM 45060]